MTQRTRLMLAAIPAVFFWFIIMVGFNIISIAVRQYDGPLSSLGYVLTFYGNGIFGVISLVCLCLFLRDVKDTNPAWYLGIPLGFAIAVIAVGGFVLPVLRSIMDVPYGIETGAVIIYVSLPFFCALFFWSLKDVTRWIPVYTAVALMIGIVSVMIISATLFPAQSGPGEIRGDNSPAYVWTMVYILFGLPLLGVLFPAIAYRYGRVMPDSVTPAKDPANGKRSDLP